MREVGKKRKPEKKNLILSSFEFFKKVFVINFNFFFFRSSFFLYGL